PKRNRHDTYNRHSYGDAIERGCLKAEIPVFTANQIRHTYATRVRHQFGLEAAQVVLGHSKADVTQVYAERNLSLARDVAAKIGCSPRPGVRPPDSPHGASVGLGPIDPGQPCPPAAPGASWPVDEILIGPQIQG